MSTKSLVKSAGLLVTRDSIDVQHVRLGPGVPARLRRFSLFIKEALLAAQGTAGLVAARLVALDGIRPSDLYLVQTGLPQLYVWRGMTHVEWREETPPRCERRTLSASTLTALNDCRSLANVAVDLTAELSSYLQRSETYSKMRAKDRAKELERDALCWWYQALPMALFFHVSGLQPLSAVSRLCLACEQMRMVPVAPDQEALDDPMADTESCAELLDIAAMSEGADERPVVLRQALDRLQSADAEPDNAARRRWVVELLQLRFVALQAGPITSLLMAWLVDLCESGTMRSEDPSKETPKKYFGKAAEPLLAKLRGFPPAIAEWTLELLEVMYAELIDEELALNPGGGSARSLATALSNFHCFLVEWFDVPPLRRRLHDAVPLIAVRANVVWTDAINLAFGWINGVSDDLRLQASLKIILCIAREAPARATELLFLRIGNISKHDGHLEIEIAPSLKYGRLKTRAAQRRLRITDAYAAALIWSWRLERKAGGAGDDALLFADPVDSGLVYRRHTVSTIVTVLLRAATGDARTVGHDLRHTVVSGLNATVLDSSSIVDINRLADNGTLAGHVTSMTSLVHYTHLYESALRHWLDAALVTLVPMTSAQSSGLLGFSALNLRQKASRNGSDSAAYSWMLMRESKPPTSAPPASAAWSWTAPVAPPSRRPGAVELSVAICRLMLSALVARNGAKEVASHFMLTSGEIEALRDAALKTVHESIRYTWPDKFDIRVKLPLGLEESLAISDIDLGEATVGKFEKLYQWLTVKQDGALLASAHASWRDCRVGNYLSLDEPARALGLLRLLSMAGVDPQALRVCYRTGDDNMPTDPTAFAVAKRDFAVVFGMQPRTWPVRTREWTSATYLQWDSSDCIQKPHAASGSIRGLDAWMVVIGAHVNHWNLKGDTLNGHTI